MKEKASWIKQKKLLDKTKKGSKKQKLYDKIKTRFGKTKKYSWIKQTKRRFNKTKTG